MKFSPIVIIRYLVVVAAVLNGSGVYAQQLLQLSGTVVDAESNQPISHATVLGGARELLAITDEDGRFALRRKAGTYTISISNMGYQTATREITLARDTALHIPISRTSLTLELVNVTASERGLGSVSVIDRQAISHIQAYSIKDALQLVPGQLADNPDLLSPQQFMLRQVSAGGDNTDADRAAALGTQFMLDGVPLSNNGNMQFDVHTSFPSSAGRGFDLRGVSADRIESIEVIRGIPSARYGDLTSGIVKVTTRLDSTPAEVRLRINPDIYEVSGHLGRSFGPHQLLNIHLDYLSAASDKRTPIQDFRRISGTVAWQRRTAGLRQLHKLSAYTTVDDTRSDPTSSWYASPRKSSDRQVSWSSNVQLSGIGGMGRGNVEALFSASYQHQQSSQSYFVSRDAMLLSEALVDTVMPGFYGETNYVSATTVDGRPLNLYGLLHTDWQLGEIVRHRLSAGVEYRMDANLGAGRQFDPRRPPNLGANRGARPEDFSSLRPLHLLSVYAEDQLSYQLFGLPAITQLGVRLDQQFVGRGSSLVPAPRLNHRFTLARGLHLNIGAGIAAKMPTVYTIYQGNRYIDLISLNHFANDPRERLGIVTTRVYDLNNEHLRPYRSRKVEAGIQWESAFGSYVLTAYREQSNDAFGTYTALLTIPYPVYGVQERPPGEPPVLYPDPVRQGIFFAGIARPANNQVLINRGLEYTVELPEIAAIRTQVVLNGLLGYSRNYDNTPAINGDHLNRQDANTPFILIYQTNAGNHNLRMNTSLRAIHHLPRIGFVFSVLWQTVWRESSHYQALNPAPIGMVDRSGNYRPLTAAEAGSEEMRRYYRQFNLQPSSLPPLHLVNLRVSKEWRGRGQFSFFVNNLLNSRPLHLNGRTGLRQRRNPPLFFGAEISIQFTNNKPLN